MPEWSIGAVSKTVDQLAWSQGSNPCLSADETRSRWLVADGSLLFFRFKVGGKDIPPKCSLSMTPQV